MKHLIDTAFKTLESIMGETITVFPHDGSPSFELRGLFEETSTHLDLSGSREVVTTDPYIIVRYEDSRVRGELPPSSHRTVRTGPYTALHVNQAR